VDIVDIHERIDAALEKLEQEEDVRIVYACESGSRAWGFESRDSDCDVRFLFLHPAKRYLSVSPDRDVIERLRMTGWTYPDGICERLCNCCASPIRPCSSGCNPRSCTGRFPPLSPGFVH